MATVTGVRKVLHRYHRTRGVERCQVKLGRPRAAARAAGSARVRPCGESRTGGGRFSKTCIVLSAPYACTSGTHVQACIGPAQNDVEGRMPRSEPKCVCVRLFHQPKPRAQLQQTEKWYQRLT